MERRRIPYERERWLSAVLIVAAITGVSLVVPRWPVATPAPPPPVALLSARALPLIDLPGAVVAPQPLEEVSTSRRPAASPVRASTPVPVVMAGVVAPSVPANAVLRPGSEPRGAALVPEMLLLASRRADLTAATAAPTDESIATSASSPHAFVELPAVAVTRVVIVAGRGIRTGLRATGAAFRAAF